MDPALRVYGLAGVQILWAEDSGNRFIHWPDDPRERPGRQSFQERDQASASLSQHRIAFDQYDCYTRWLWRSVWIFFRPRRELFCDLPADGASCPQEEPGRMET